MYFAKDRPVYTKDTAMSMVKMWGLWSQDPSETRWAIAKIVTLPQILIYLDSERRA